MTAEEKTAALERLGRKLELTEPTAAQTARMEDAVLEAEERMLRYLGTDGLPEGTGYLLAELARLCWLGAADGGTGGVKSASYSEGQVSQSESYRAPEELERGREELLSALARYRRVSCRGAGDTL